MKNKPLKIIVLGYLRPAILKACLDGLYSNALAKNASVTICIDGLKADASEMYQELHAETVAVANSENRFAENLVLINKENLGVTKQYFDKFSLFFEDNDQLVVVEDDVVVGSYFLDFVTEAFSRYGTNPKLGVINGYVYYVPFIKKSNRCYFTVGGGNQAFGLTKTFWKQMDLKCSGSELLKTDADLRNRFNSNGVDYTNLLFEQLEGRHTGAWDAIFWWNIFSKGLLSLSPDRTLSTNIGWNSVGSSHTFIDNPFETRIFDDKYRILNFPEVISPDLKTKKLSNLYFRHFFRFKYRWVKLTMFIKKMRK
jgi:hypothetical protein